MPLIGLIIISIFCAIQDARTYRISDYLNAILFLGGILVIFLFPGQGAPIQYTDAFISFLLIYPFLFFIWYGHPLPSSSPDVKEPEEVQNTGFWETFDSIFRLFIVPSVFTWSILFVYSVIFISPIFAWSALPMVLVALILSAWEKKRSWMGGGDKKMLGSAFLMSGITGATALCVWLSLAILVLVAFLWAIRRVKVVEGWAARRVPAGIAIAVGYTALIIERGYYQSMFR
jgi:Flp pilus assembly protein protease CpaA